MRNAGAYLKSWFGRFESVAQPRPDPWLWLPALALLLMGLLMVLNTTYFLSLEKTGAPFYLFKRHLLNTAAGVIGMLVLSQLSVRGLRRLVLPLSLVAMVMLLAVWVPGLGVTRGGARRWLRFGPLMAEPSELVKLAAAFFLAFVLSRRGERMNRLTAPLLAILIIASLAALLLKQPDFGAAVMLGLLLLAMLFVAGTPTLYLAGAGASALGLFLFQAGRRAYRVRRLAVFLDPWRSARGAGFQLVQSFIALGAGGGWGVGLGAGRQKMFYLPQAHTDFVFAVVGEEFGLAGALVVIGLFVTIVWRGMRIAHDETDPFASLLAVGLTALLSFQALINMAVVTGLLPTKGLPLPFLSYGGSATVVSMAALGALLALGRQQAVR